MAYNYTQIYIHLVFSVASRDKCISYTWANRLYEYIGGILRKNKNIPIAINGMPDHIHILFSLHPSNTISQVVKECKQSSSKWINENRLTPGIFRWQNGYGAFSYSPSHIESVKHYIINQQEHHLKRSFVDEYREILSKFGVEFDPESDKTFV